MSLANAIRARLGHEVEVLVGAPGAFEIFGDGQPIFSKLHEGRFPDQDEVLAWLGPRSVCG